MMHILVRSSSPRRRLAAALFLPLLLVGASCSTATDLADEPAPAPAVTGDDSIESPTDGTEATSPDAERTGSVADQPRPASALADLITQLPPAPTGLPEPQPDQPRPLGLTIDALGIDIATVIGVGVEPNGDMEIPPADEVGWYRYGPSPGQQGSAVLAAHIAFDGTDGVFVDLKDLELGSLISVSYDDGSTTDFVAVSKEQYDKTQLPRDTIFGRSGDPQLVLITCGGEFNRQVRSYDDNVVIYANPVPNSRTSDTSSEGGVEQDGRSDGAGTERSSGQA